MGVYSILGYELHEIKNNIQKIDDLISKGGWNSIIEEYKETQKTLVLLGKGIHKIKKKAEQIACQKAIKEIEK